MIDQEDLTVVCPVIRLDGKVYTLAGARRHADIIRHFAALCDMLSPRCENGFVLSSGQFASRKQAMSVALKAGQVAYENLSNPRHGLFSDDLWSEE